MPKYTIPWTALLPVFGITVFTMSIGSLVDWHYRFFRTEGKPRRMAMDYFDNIMAERDEKLTGNMYRQQIHSTAAQ